VVSEVKNCSIQQYNFEESCENTQNYNAFWGRRRKKGTSKLVPAGKEAEADVNEQNAHKGISISTF